MRSYLVRVVKMKRVMLIGPGGAGKSTLARKMGASLGLPVHHLDRLNWRPNWVPTPKEEWMRIQEDLCAEAEWIIDGNYSGTMDIRLRACDTVVFLDLSRWLCVFRALKRSVLYSGKPRPDMTEGCDERFNLEFLGFLRWIWDYPQTKRPGILQQLEEMKEDKRVIILRSRREVDRFLRSLA